VCARTGQTLRHGFAKTSPGTRDQGNASIQSNFLCHAIICFFSGTLIESTALALTLRKFHSPAWLFID
jgi:hypothetical protein